MDFSSSNQTESVKDQTTKMLMSLTDDNFVEANSKQDSKLRLNELDSNSKL